MSIAMANSRKERIHPHKFILWMGLGSILMMFAGLTSAYILKRNMAGWQTFSIPQAFYYSTAVVGLSSFTMWKCVHAFKMREMRRYKMFILVTSVLGIIFVGLQTLGFYELVKQGSALGVTNSVDFLYVIVGLHAIHVLAGIVILVVMLLKAFSVRVRNYALVPVELTATYWHFVGILWVYLLIFLILIR